MCVDQRDDWLAKLPLSPKLHAIQLAEPRDFVPQLHGDEFVVCMTMGHKTDRPILHDSRSPIDRRQRAARVTPAAAAESNSAARKWELPYLGVIGSQAKRKVLRARTLRSGHR